jgi:DNA polymerase III epsilon subunit-like protein
LESDVKIAIIDTETTGFAQPSIVELDKQPRIIELGMIIVEDGKPIVEHNWLINPGNLPLSAEITKITGIKTEDLEDMPQFSEIVEDIKAVFQGCTHLIAHNAPFDTALLRFDLERSACCDFPWPTNIICSVQEYVPIFGKRMTLKALYLAIMGMPLAQTHRAIDDAKALYDILQKDNFFDNL